MNRTVRIATLVVVMTACSPALACASEAAPLADGSVVPSWLPYAAGLASLLVALGLLAEVLLLRKLAFGAAISSSVSYVVAAVVCLVASALVFWLANFVPSVTVSHAVLASNLLVTAAMGLLVAYFATVRARLLRFVRDLTRSLDDAPRANAELR